MANQELHDIVNKHYPYGFVTEVESNTVPTGLNEDIIRLISAKKNEPDFMLKWRLQAFAYWQTMTPPEWAHLRFPPIDFQSIVYYSAPKSSQSGPKSLADVDPKLIENFNKMGIPLHEQGRLAGVDRKSVV